MSLLVGGDINPPFDLLDMPSKLSSAKFTLLAICVASMWATTAATAAPGSSESSWDLRVGVGHLRFNESATLQLAGATVNGASVQADNKTTAVAELRYKFSPQWALGFTFGVPPETSIKGTGTASSLGELGKVRFGPAALTGQWNWPLTSNSTFRLGAGVARLLIVDETDGRLARLKVDEAWGSVLQVGIDTEVTRNMFLTIDAKRLNMKTRAYGSVGAANGPSARASVTLDPWVFFVGTGWRF